MTAPRPPLDDVVEALADAHPELAPRDQRLALLLYERLADGAPVTIGELAIEAERTPADVEQQLDEWTGVLRDDEGRITGFWGLSIEPTGHRLVVGHTEVHVWCPWDALFIVPILGAPGALYTNCGSTDQPIRLDLRVHGVAASSHPTPMMSFLVPDIGDETDVRDIFCQHVRMFADRGAAQRWAADHRPPVFLLDLDEAFEVAQGDLQARYGDVLADR